MRIVSSSGGQICFQAVQSGFMRPKNLKKSWEPSNSDTMLKSTWRYDTTRSVTNTASPRIWRKRAAAGGTGGAAFAVSATAHVLLFVDRPAVDLLERPVGRLFRCAVKHDKPVAHADDAVRVIAGH